MMHRISLLLILQLINYDASINININVVSIIININVVSIIIINNVSVNIMCYNTPMIIIN